MTVFEKMDVVWEMLQSLSPGSWAYNHWRQVHAELFRMAMRG